MTPPPLWNFSENSSVLEGVSFPYQVGLLSLGPEGEGTNSKTCVQFNILDFGAKHKYSQ